MAFVLNLFVIILCLRPILGITNEKNIRDSYLSAYMDSQGTNDAPVGVVYPEPSRPYGPPQPKPMPYGPPTIHPGGPLVEIAGPTFSIMDILSQLPDKLEFLPKAASVLLTVTKILLKIVVLKIILKFVFIFCLYFFLPKLEMLDMMTSMTGMEMSEPTTVKTPAVNATTAAAPEAEDQEEMRLNRMANFVMDSIEAQKFLSKFCTTDESHYKCKILKNIMKMDNTMSIPKLFSSIWIPHRDKLVGKKSTKVNYLR